VIENVELRDFYLDGILLTGNRGCRRVVVRDCVSQNNRRTGMAIVHASDVTVERSTFSGNRGQSPEAGVNCEPNAGESVRNVRFVGCTFSGNAGVGLYVHRGQGVGNAEVTVEDSVIEGNSYGIVVNNLDGLLIRGNRVSNHAVKGRSGIVLGENTRRASILDNTLNDNYRGILAGHVSGLTIRGNTLVGLGAGVGGGEDGHGIDCRRPRGAAAAAPSVVAGNAVRSFPGSGIVAQGLSNLQVLDNVFEETGRRGIHLRGTTHSEIRGNEVSATGRETAGRYDGIELEQASSHNRIAGNRIRRGTAMRQPIGIARDCVGNQVSDNVVVPD
jgi:nitrous oxidase accessory protein NosD